MSLFLQQDYNTLAHPGNIGFYKSCEVTQLYLLDKTSKKISNVFILVCFEEKPFVATNQKYLTKLLKVSTTLSLGIQRYWLSLSEAAATFQHLLQTNEWDYNGDTSLALSPLTALAKQFVPSHEEVRLNAALKNNFGGGSYVLEFFDEHKHHVQALFALDNVATLTRLSEQITAVVPLDLAVARERLGNVVFQFPVRLLVSTSQALPGRTGIRIGFHWHPSLPSVPQCLIQVESELDQIYTGSTMEMYNGLERQEVVTGNIEGQSSIKVWRTSPSLLLSHYRGGYWRSIEFEPGFIHPEQRLFLSQGHSQAVQVQSSDQSSRAKKLSTVTYDQHITNVLYTAGREKLEHQLAFKQYFAGKRPEALTDLRTLLNRYGRRGAWLWDPFISAEDLLTTLFHCQHAGALLRAIGSDNPNTKKVTGHKGRSITDVIVDYQAALTRSTLTPAGLHLEFRMQHGSHGWGFHDRFLIFPATAGNSTPRAYSLGTSINSLGKSHHVLQEVNHPQRIADAFELLWNSLADPSCLVWKI